MAADIAEQPAGYARLLEPAHAARDRRGRGRGSPSGGRATSSSPPAAPPTTPRSTRAYLTEIRLGMPGRAGLARARSPLYGARPDLSDALVVGVSQSGGSPDLSEVLRVARETGRADPGGHQQPRARRWPRPPSCRVDVAAGHERAVAATKTYTAELLALLHAGRGRSGPATARCRPTSGPRSPTLPELAAQALADRAADELAPRYRFAARMVTTGRGYAYPTAREAALKLMETSYLPALAFSGADLLHGPLAMADPDVPVLAVVGAGPGRRGDARGASTRLGERRADVVDGRAGRRGRRRRRGSPCRRSTSGTRRCSTSCRCSGWRWPWRWPAARTRTRRAG